MLYYPQTSQPADKETIRAGAHSDYGSLTLLFRLPGQSGLQLQTPEGWIDVPVSPPSTTDTTPPILVNIGDLLSYWTAGLLKSTVHRVTFSGGQERYSMAYFCHPLDDARLEAVPSRVIADFGTKGKEELGRQRERLGVGNGEEGDVITAKEHLERRLKVTYGI
jgi:isopenicillin N synthase-like dioxygenase